MSHISQQSKSNLACSPAGLKKFSQVAQSSPLRGWADRLAACEDHVFCANVAYGVWTRVSVGVRGSHIFSQLQDCSREDVAEAKSVIVGRYLCRWPEVEVSLSKAVAENENP